MWQLNDEQTELWDRYVSPDEPNHLFFHDRCHMSATKTSPGSISCSNNCREHLPPEIDLDVLVDVSNWSYTFDHSFLSSDTYYGSLEPGALNLSNVYCLAEPLDGRCHIALLPTLLMGVTLCAIIKTCTAVVITRTLSRQNQTSLVTLRDAIASFLEESDPATAGLCTLGQNDIRRLLSNKDKLIISGPRQWLPARKPRAVVVPVSEWLTSYSIFALSIAACAICLGMAHLSGAHFVGGSFLQSDENPFLSDSFTLLGGIMITNSPQLLLSLYYLTYNNLFTRLQMAREWAYFLEQYRPLRVTDPKVCLRIHTKN